MLSCWLLPALAAMGGAAAFLLRLIQDRTGFETGTGLPIPGAPAAIALVVLLAVLCAAIGVLSLRLPKGDGSDPAFPFPAVMRWQLALPLTGCLLMALAGAADLIEGLGSPPLLSDRSDAADLLGAGSIGLGGGIQVLCGILSLLTALGWLSACAVCARGDRPFRAEILLIAPAALVVRLVAIYRVCSVDPVLADYAAGLVALTLLVLGSWSLSAFAFRAGDLRRYAFYTGCAVVFCLCSLADAPRYLSSSLIFAGCSLVLLGFLLLALQTVPDRSAP